jgi:2-amino-4-hydroxy-6-hydroxymethyldihydropteridine diphosphokinase
MKIGDVYLLLGSNVGERGANLARASALISQNINVIRKQSGIYETAAWGKTDQSAFLNQAVMIQTDISAVSLLSMLKNIEKSVGRVDTEKWGPRVIDIDILFYGAEIIQTPDLQVPHPYLPVRRFALLPLAEIAGDLVHPVLKKTIKELLADCLDSSEVNVYL